MTQVDYSKRTNDMKVALEHHYGWEIHEAKGKTLEEAACNAVRDTHEFLTDDNHTIKAEPNQKLEWGGKTDAFNCVTVYRNENSPPYIGPDWADVPYWFAVSYKPSDEVIKEE